jgi:hypothetical protein
MCCMDDGVWLQEKNMSNPTNDITLILALPYFLHTDLIALYQNEADKQK